MTDFAGRYMAYGVPGGKGRAHCCRYYQWGVEVVTSEDESKGGGGGGGSVVSLDVPCVVVLSNYIKEGNTLKNYNAACCLLLLSYPVYSISKPGTQEEKKKKGKKEKRKKAIQIAPLKPPTL